MNTPDPGTPSDTSGSLSDQELDLEISTSLYDPSKDTGLESMQDIQSLARDEPDSTFFASSSQSQTQSGATKRRFANAVSPPSSARARRREPDIVLNATTFVGKRGNVGVSGGGSGWAEGGKTKDDLIDAQLVEQLRARFGDPFDESVVKSAA